MQEPSGLCQVSGREPDLCQTLKAMGFPGFIAGFFTKGIPKLKRWNP